MNLTLLWLFGLILLEAAVFIFVLYLVHTFTRSYDREWPTQENVIPNGLDGQASADQVAAS